MRKSFSKLEISRDSNTDITLLLECTRIQFRSSYTTENNINYHIHKNMKKLLDFNAVIKTLVSIGLSELTQYVSFFSQLTAVVETQQKRIL